MGGGVLGSLNTPITPENGSCLPSTLTPAFGLTGCRNKFSYQSYQSLAVYLSLMSYADVIRFLEGAEIADVERQTKAYNTAIAPEAENPTRPSTLLGNF